RRYIWADFSLIPELQENRKEKAEVDKTNGAVWLQRWQNGVCSLNEWISSWDGEKGTGDIYEKKIFELSEEEVQQVKNYINLKSNGNTSPEDTGVKETSGSDSVQ